MTPSLSQIGGEVGWVVLLERLKDLPNERPAFTPGALVPCESSNLLLHFFRGSGGTRHCKRLAFIYWSVLTMGSSMLSSEDTKFYLRKGKKIQVW